MTIASTPWLMKLRTAAICAAGSLSAALKIRSKPFAVENAFFMDSVFALRQPDSEPVWANPTLIGPVRLAPRWGRRAAAAARGATAAGRDDRQGPQHGDTG